jgi:hypothetical protein
MIPSAILAVLGLQARRLSVILFLLDVLDLFRGAFIGKEKCYFLATARNNAILEGGVNQSHGRLPAYVLRTQNGFFGVEEYRNTL